MPGDLESGGRDVCMPERQSDKRPILRSGLYKRGGVNVLVCSCLGERSACVCGGGWLQIKSEVSIFEGL